MRRGLETNVDPVTGKIVKPITRETVADMFKSGGNAELEKGELHVYKMTGEELRRVLEFSAGRNEAPKSPTLAQMVRNAFSDKPLNPETEGHGYFSQVAGLKHRLRLIKTGRKSHRQYLHPRNGNNGYVPLRR